jgi:ABC-type transport system involved in multi-copper enzyme maturation permease subunit
MRSAVAALVRKDLREIAAEPAAAFSVGLGLVFFPLMASSLTVAGLVFTAFLAFSYGINLFSLEEKYRTERFFAALPVRRRDIVLSRYAGMVLVMMAWLVLALVYNAALTLVAQLIGRPSRPLSWGYCALAMAGVLLYPSIAFPFYFRMGALKARMLSILFLLVPMVPGFVLGLSQVVSLPGTLVTASAKWNWLVTVGGLPAALVLAATLALFGVSALVSARMYEARDL